jgi:hypothetical protein
MRQDQNRERIADWDIRSRDQEEKDHVKLFSIHSKSAAVLSGVVGKGYFSHMSIRSILSI